MYDGAHNTEADMPDVISVCRHCRHEDCREETYLMPRPYDGEQPWYCGRHGRLTDDDIRYGTPVKDRIIE